MRVCSRRGCKTKTRQGYIMCHNCWAQVPAEIQAEVWAAARGDDRKAKIVAVRRAIESLRPLEAEEAAK